MRICVFSSLSSSSPLSVAKSSVNRLAITPRSYVSSTDLQTVLIIPILAFPSFFLSLSLCWTSTTRLTPASLPSNNMCSYLDIFIHKYLESCCMFTHRNILLNNQYNNISEDPRFKMPSERRKDEDKKVDYANSATKRRENQSKTGMHTKLSLTQFCTEE